MRPFAPEDLDALVRLHAEESFWWYPLRRGMTPDETAAFLSGVLKVYESTSDPAQHAVVERATGSLAGWGGLSVPRFLPEVLPAVGVGWRLGSEFRRRGYATELGAAAVQWGFTSLGLDEILSIFEPENEISGQVMDRLGFGPGRETIHPTRGLPLIVRTLTAEVWRSRRAERLGN